MRANYSQQTIPTATAQELLESLGQQANLSPNDRLLLQAYLESIPQITPGFYRLDQLYGLLDNLQKAITEGDAEFLGQPRGYKFSRVVDVLEFVESKSFGNAKRDVWPATKDSLWKIFHSDPEPLEIILTGCAGGGKSEVCKWSLCYLSYLLGCMHSPHGEFGLSHTSTIYLLVQSKKKELAQDAIFDKLRRTIDDIPWFSEHYPRNQKINERIVFGNNVEIKPITGDSDAGLSKDVIAFVLTEANYFEIVKDSVKLQHSDKLVWDAAEEAYNTLRLRIKTRFSRPDGGFWGKILIDSSAKYEGDFTARRLEEAQSDPTKLVINRKLWEARPGYSPNEPCFYVQLPGDAKPARILQRIDDADNWGPEIDRKRLKDTEYLETELNVLRVPERHRTDFEKDIEQALRDLAGYRSAKTSRFIPFSSKITLAQQRFTERTGGHQIFKVNDISLRDLFGDQSPDWSLLFDFEYLARLKLEGDYNYAVHVDASLSGDATGIAVTRILGHKVVEKSHLYNQTNGQLHEVSNFELPEYCVDGLLRIKARVGEHIDLDTVRDIVLELKKYLNIKYGSADWMDLQSSLQAWARHKIIAGPVSVDRTPKSYVEFKQAIGDERILVAPHPVFDYETRRLQRIIKGGRIKIDHVQGESKDLADSVAGSVGVLQSCEAMIRAIRQQTGTDKQADAEGQSDTEPMRVSRRRYGGRAAVAGFGRRSF